METINFIITGVGGQGTILASDVLSAVGLAAGYDVKKSDILGLAVRGGAVVGHVRWGEKVHSPIVPDGCVDYLIAFETLEAMRWLKQLRPTGKLILNQQEIYPVSTITGGQTYPSQASVDQAIQTAVDHVLKVPGVEIALDVGNSRIVNVVLLGALSASLPVAPEIWETALKERVPSRYVDLNLQAFHRGRALAQEE